MLAQLINQPGHNIPYKFACSSSEDSDQSACMLSLTKLFAGHFVVSQGSKATPGGQRRLADLSLPWTHMQSCRKCGDPGRFHSIFKPSRNEPQSTLLDQYIVGHTILLHKQQQKRRRRQNNNNNKGITAMQFSG